MDITLEMALPTIARQIQSDLWESASSTHSSGKTTIVHKMKSSSGTWEYTIEEFEGIPYEVTRFNGHIVDKSISHRILSKEAAIIPTELATNI